MLGTGAVAAATLAAPSILHAQTKTLKITTWGGKWGEIMKATVLPAFEKEFKCTVQADQAFPFVPEAAGQPKNDPLYDVLHTNSNEQWNCVHRRPGDGQDHAPRKRPTSPTSIPMR